MQPYHIADAVLHVPCSRGAALCLQHIRRLMTTHDNVMDSRRVGWAAIAAAVLIVEPTNTGDLVVPR